MLIVHLASNNYVNAFQAILVALFIIRKRTFSLWKQNPHIQLYSLNRHMMLLWDYWCYAAAGSSRRSWGLSFWLCSRRVPCSIHSAVLLKLPWLSFMVAGLIFVRFYCVWCYPLYKHFHRNALLDLHRMYFILPQLTANALYAIPISNAFPRVFSGRRAAACFRFGSSLRQYKYLPYLKLMKDYQSQSSMAVKNES